MCRAIVGSKSYREEESKTEARGWKNSGPSLGVKSKMKFQIDGNGGNRGPSDSPAGQGGGFKQQTALCLSSLLVRSLSEAQRQPGINGPASRWGRAETGEGLCCRRQVC